MANRGYPLPGGMGFPVPMGMDMSGYKALGLGQEAEIQRALQLGLLAMPMDLRHPYQAAPPPGSIPHSAGLLTTPSPDRRRAGMALPTVSMPMCNAARNASPGNAVSGNAFNTVSPVHTTSPGISVSPGGSLGHTVSPGGTLGPGVSPGGTRGPGHTISPVVIVPIPEHGSIKRESPSAARGCCSSPCGSHTSSQPSPSPQPNQSTQPPTPRTAQQASPSQPSPGNNNRPFKFSIEDILSRKDPERKDPERRDVGEVPQDLSVDRSSDPRGEEDASEDGAGARFSWLQCTRYKPPKLPRSKKKEGVKKRKLGRNPRVPFTQHQVSVLERKFRHTHYLSSVDVAELSAALNLTETRVKIWFQNRRARERRDRDSGVQPHTPSSSLGGALYSPTHPLASSAVPGLHPLPWPAPCPPKPSVMAHFNHVSGAAGKGSSAFSPVSLCTYC